MLKSVSLPRIKSSDPVNGTEADKKDMSLKFKKIRISDVQQQQNAAGIPPLKQRTERSQSVAVGLTKEDRSNLKTQRMNINLMEKKIRDGVYDEQVEVGTDLTSLKRTCSEYTSEIAATNTTIERMQKAIEDIKSQIAIYSNNTDAVAKIVDERKQKYSNVRARVEEAGYEKSRLLQMIKDRKVDNITVLGRVEDSKYDITRLKKHIEILARYQLEAKDRDNKIQNQYHAALNQFELKTKSIRKEILQEEQKYQRLAEGEIERDDRKRKMVTISESVVLEQNQRIFTENYNKFLANKVFNRFMEDKMNRMMDNNQKILHLFRNITQSFGPFSAAEFSKRFFNQQPEKQKIQTQVKDLEKHQTKLEKKQKDLKKLSSELEIEYLALGQQIDNRSPEDKQQTAAITEKAVQADEKLKVMGAWSEKTMKRLQQLLLQKSARTQNIKGLSLTDRISKILGYLRQSMSQAAS